MKEVPDIFIFRYLREYVQNVDAGNVDKVARMTSVNFIEKVSNTTSWRRFSSFTNLAQESHLRNFANERAMLLAMGAKYRADIF